MTAAATVLFLAGDGRSGSTVLARMLGEAESFFSAGEVRYLWQRGIIEGRSCECGKHVLECELWSAVLHDAYGPSAAQAAADVVRLDRALLRLRSLPAALMAQAAGSAPARYDELTSHLGQVYTSLRRVTGATVVVDSSKLPTYGLALAQVSSLDVRVVHLIRDPRAQAWSWLRKKAVTDGKRDGVMATQPPAKSAALWTTWNAVASRFFADGAYMRLRYEDLVAQPASTVANVVRFAAGGSAVAPAYDGNSIRVSPGHSVAGNPNRMSAGIVTMRPDNEWATAMPRSTRTLVTTIAAPLMTRYGYPMRGACA